jgi:hypothetical protein
MVDWEKNWRGNGVVAAVLFLVAEALYGKPPKVGASANDPAWHDDMGERRLLGAGRRLFTVRPRTGDGRVARRGQRLPGAALLRGNDT